VDEIENDRDRLKRQLQDLSEQSEALFLACRFRSALRLTREVVRTARAHGQVIQYMYGLFDLMRVGHGLLDPQMTRQAAVELVVLLQDEEQARRIQPDLDDAVYNWVCNWMSSCAYDNLAEATGVMSGYNSPGMHECINEGIQVCRQTGKTECIKCFREYAADVYQAGDDLAMVRHQCQTLLEYRDDEAQRDRRWSAHQHLGWVNLMEGRLVKAKAETQKAVELSAGEQVYQKLRSGSLSRLRLDEIHLLLGQPEQLSTPLLPDDFDVSEWPKLELERAKVEALQAACAGQFDLAIEILAEWDRRLTELGCLNEWFEIRLRLVAVYLLAGNRSRAEALSKGLEAKAQEAQDHLTVRRWKRLMAPGAQNSPLPTLAALDAGPFGANPRSTDSDPDLDDLDDFEEDEQPRDDVIEAPTPLSGLLSDYMQQIIEADDDEAARHAILESILEHTPDEVAEAGDGAYLVHLSRFVATGTEDAERIWEWACRMRSRFSDDAVMLNVVASLGHFFRSSDPETFHDRIPLADLERWIRLSLSLNHNHPRNYARAGIFFLEEGLAGDAEQCFSRAFRLDRTDATVAHQLADLYRETDRPRDALAVLDICLRKGSTDENVAWEAAMTALQLSQYDMLLTYLKRYGELAEKEQTWLHYYRGLALFHLELYAECLQELDLELKFTPPGLMHLHVIRLCAYDRLGKAEEARAELGEFMKLRFTDVEYLSLHGLVRLAESLCETIETWSVDDPWRKRAFTRLLRAGLISDSYFQLLRQSHQEIESVQFYRVQLLQPLDETWPGSEGCLAGQQGWESYLIDWGVLAESEAHAVELALEFQNQCETAAARAVDVISGDESFRTQPGVVWQGYRRDESEVAADD